ncbi:ligase-associated DNA damage response exonuclease [Cesiribacter andamanensis]|uniref:F0F1-type ATP synthase, epsilon subunit n=1 Tax=Cesiribacter andamanensis AMV16 TaxID=1279009 RepID=M7NZX5_9BACT|nr:ligase-associated DNA damage response exonuclease [Cesiribacter andamanensis]EMR03919.1 F0F1-type ATP synthase, epsilon subunit [Cesiribacter andamanensis AMV16]
MHHKNLLEINDCGIYCPQADVYIDPWKPVNKALITHAHGDHSRWGNKFYLAHRQSEAVMRLRLGADINLQTVAYGEQIIINGVRISYHPAGHITGSAQIRLEYGGQVWVASGDYKTEQDKTCTPFEPVRCHTFITESTFGLPIYSWRPEAEIFAEMNAWWRSNRELGFSTLVCGYSLGKAQRIIANADPEIGPILLHGAVHNVTEALRQDGLQLPPTRRLTSDTPKELIRGSLVVAPPSALNTPWMRKLQPVRTAMASGWMNLRGAKRRRAVDRGFVLSDHADWQGLNEAIRQTGAQQVLVTHGYTAAFSRWLQSQGYDAREVQTLYTGELGELQEVDEGASEAE